MAEIAKAFAEVEGPEERHTDVARCLAEHGVGGDDAVLLCEAPVLNANPRDTGDVAGDEDSRGDNQRRIRCDAAVLMRFSVSASESIAISRRSVAFFRFSTSAMLLPAEDSRQTNASILSGPALDMYCSVWSKAAPASPLVSNTSTTLICG